MAIVKVEPTIDRDAQNVINFTDSDEGRALVNEGQDDFLPYNAAYEAEATLVGGEARNNYDSAGFFVELRIDASSNPQALQPGRTYTLGFFNKHPSLPKFVMAEMAEQRVRFAAMLDQFEGDPFGVNPDGSPAYRSAPILLEVHRAVEPLDVKLRLRNTFVRRTRNGKDLHKLSFELA